MHPQDGTQKRMKQEIDRDSLWFRHLMYNTRHEILVDALHSDPTISPPMIQTLFGDERGLIRGFEIHLGVPNLHHRIESGGASYDIDTLSRTASYHGGSGTGV